MSEVMNYISHTGVAHDADPPGRGSGRYAWGSGEDGYQRMSGKLSFREQVKDLRSKGFSESEIAKELCGPDATLADMRFMINREKQKELLVNVTKAWDMYNDPKYKGKTKLIADDMGVPESTVRTWLKKPLEEYKDKTEIVADKIQAYIDKQKMPIDVGVSIEYYLDCTNNMKENALRILETERGYKRGYALVDQPTSGAGKKTTVMLMCPPDTDVNIDSKGKPYVNWKKTGIGSIVADNSKDINAMSNNVFKKPVAIDPKRVSVRYAEDGGTDMDGVIQVRKGVDDLDLGGSRYCQARINVGDTHYLKGMVIYADDDDLPPGVDIVFNTNKKRGTPMMGDDKDHTVLKQMKKDKNGNVDWENPFGATIKSGEKGQRIYKDENGVEHQSAINKVNDEGDWDLWSKKTSSQVLSKQPKELIQQQTKLTVDMKRAELDEIKSLTNPVIKKDLLEQFASSCDGNASDLSVTGFRGQKFQVLLPLTKIPPNEIYAPNFDNGDKVAVIRYPHAGPFEIAVLTVNNNNPQGKKIYGMTKDAVGIHPSVTPILSGADFDGDTGLVIPIASNRLKLKTQKPLEGMDTFDPKSFKLPDDAPQVTNKTKQTNMGKVTNLIADMSIAADEKGVPEKDIIRAVKHSMVVIDSEKHHLDWRASEEEFGINELKRKYQGTNDKGQPKGASTIITQAKSDAYIVERKEVTRTSDMTPEELKRWNNGDRVFRETGKTKAKTKTLYDPAWPEDKKAKALARAKRDPSWLTDKEAELLSEGRKVVHYDYDNQVLKQVKVHKMDLVDDATLLVRDKTNEKEMAYAQFANDLKDLAREARRTSRSIKPTPVDPKAKEVYAREVDSLNKKLRIAESNQPLERRATILANQRIAEKKALNPDLDYEHLKKIKGQEMVKARQIVGAKKETISITDSEWEAIQANAISTNKLIKILRNTDQDSFKQRALPKDLNYKLSDSVKTQIRNKYLSLIRSSNPSVTPKELAAQYNISLSYLYQLVNS